MDKALRLDRASAAPGVDAPARPDRMLDDKAMLRTAAELTRELNTPSPTIYWADLLASCVVGYGALAAAFLAPTLGWTIVAGVVAVLGLYRAMSFIHELTHVKHAALPGFRLGWNVLVGVPLLIPSFMYEGVHNLHHARTRYGTAEDPEYLPLALMKPWSLPLFILVSALAPVALLFRYAVLSPLSALIPALRRVVVERYSALSINPAFRRRPPEGAFKAQWRRIEIAASLWGIALIALVATGIVPLRWFVIFLVVASGVAVINQLRTLVAHLWENEGEPMSVTAQYLDTVNVPPPATLPALWAPVGLRYHALHHLLPGVPYHALGEAHRRITAALEPGSPYHKASYAGMFGLVVKIGRSTMIARR
ncbi:fatty acid desaturase family protein [Hephaestia mangrovi]|uniref:fatty acid desaturase family protein n=1 Tax=Hephaestia mangrovi TaxID=2873268 RepID=UPI001CA79196|nr:fatty acid desaturase [Hephaestia mangrovi]MBY8826609.1 fatty acid desaturase [Hephaestia mangrovi]